MILILQLEDKEKQLQILEEIIALEATDPAQFEMRLKEEGISSSDKIKKQQAKLKTQILEATQPKQSTEPTEIQPQQFAESTDEVLEGLQKRRKVN